MLIPRFTVRWLLVLTAVCAVLAYIAAMAVEGSVWGQALVITFITFLSTFFLYGLVFCFARLLGWALRWRMRPEPAQSPFATHTPPPQLIRPSEPD